MFNPIKKCDYSPKMFISVGSLLKRIVFAVCFQTLIVYIQNKGFFVRTYFHSENKIQTN